MMQSHPTHHPSDAGISSSHGKVEMKIHFTSPHGRNMEGIFFTGDRLSAEVLLTAKMPINCYRVVFKCVGVAKLGNTTKRIFHEEKILLGSKTSKNFKVDRRTDAYRLPVSIDLPDGIIPSVTCKANYVKYYCMAKIVRRAFKNNIKTVQHEFLVYQDNSNYKNSLQEYEVPLDQQEYYKDISISYQLAKTGFSLGETPTIAGEIYNSSSSTAKLKVGIDIIQCTKVNGYLNLGVKQFKMKDKQQREQFGPWSGVLTVGPRATENFSAEITLKSLPPTTNCEQIDITYQVMLKLVVEKNLSFLKPKKLCFPHPIIVVRPANGRPPMTKSISKVSLGRHSLRRKPTEPRRSADAGTPESYKISSLHQMSSPPPCYTP